MSYHRTISFFMTSSVTSDKIYLARSMKFVMLIYLKLQLIANSFLLNIAEHENSSANKYEMPTNVRIFIFISRKNFMLNLGPGHLYLELKVRSFIWLPGDKLLT